MTSAPPPGSSCWPTPAQELLLEAGLFEPARGLESWRRWRAENDLDRIDWRSMRLLPLIYRNLAAVASDEPDWGVVTGVYRRAWTSNQLLFRDAAAVLELIHANAVPTMALKGAALARLDYGDDGVRPMADADVLVPREHAADVIRLLSSHGWTSPIANLADALDVRYGSTLTGPDGVELDLHWGIFWYPGDEAPFWERAVPLELGGAATSALAPTDQLLHVCVHGSGWSHTSFRWVADATTVLAGGRVDWDEFVATARRRRVSWGLAPMLAYLSERLEVDVPGEALEDLRATVLPRHIQRAHAALTQPTGFRRDLRMRWECYRVLAEQRGQRPTPRGFAAFLRPNWGYESNWPLVARGAKRVTQAGVRQLRATQPQR